MLEGTEAAGAQAEEWSGVCEGEAAAVRGLTTGAAAAAGWVAVAAAAAEVVAVLAAAAGGAWEVALQPCGWAEKAAWAGRRARLKCRERKIRNEKEDIDQQLKRLPTNTIQYL